jgi:hypothetical protein
MSSGKWEQIYFTTLKKGEKGDVKKGTFLFLFDWVPSFQNRSWHSNRPIK